ncbi:hypothetical protein QBC33DRAFT_542795 [Phialemonium atrogriseum]|uniref:Glycoside hydrolase 131 catalytic N-terminal domain-containing protein n=1 Tax=Phialemonium atrogriseum TaxID=1093897 RepID=A0AAJ0FKR8_9PEZI|nr:uncharacterized protein QBC33DRAFT_542795 [Phialemonium atrogriseum]KAK1765884.1 hypothetical protein QBC33DRAFT_542795 [Phialemonium atrogriseum]
MVSSRSFSAASVLSLASSVLAQTCTLQFDGRIPADFGVASFDTANNFFSSGNVFGQGLKFSQLLKTPAATGSLFDTNTIPVEVTISDKSIFAPSADNIQTGFRRAELLPASNSGTDPSTTGVKTLHFSLMKDAQRPLNLSHEYQLVFLESNDFSTNQLVLKTGTLIGGGGGANPDTLQLFGNVNSPQLLFSTPFTPGVFHNFAVTLDFNKLTSQVFFSTGTAALKAVTQALPNDVSGQGQFHFGVLKKPTDGGNDIVHNGFQEAGIDEGIIYGGIFQEDSSTGCVSLSP